MTPLSSEQPSSYAFRLWAGPIGMSLTFILLEVCSAIWYGFRGLESSLQWWAVEFSFVLLSSVPLISTSRSVQLRPDYIEVEYYVRPRKRVLWSDITRAAIFEIEESNDGEHHMLRLISEGHSPISLTDRMTNWDSVVGEVANRLGTRLSREPTRAERLLWGPWRKKTSH